MVDPKQLARESAREVLRQSILEAAERVFIEKGFYKARMAEIASEAGLATGTLYNYFSSKEAIFHDLMTSRGEAIMSEIGVAIAQVESPLARIETMFRSVMGFIEKQRPIFMVFTEMAATQLPEQVRCGHDEIHDRFYALLSQSIQEGQECGELRNDVSADLIATVLSSSMDGIIQKAVDSGSPTLDELASTALDLLFHGVKK